MNKPLEGRSLLGNDWINNLLSPSEVKDLREKHRKAVLAVQYFMDEGGYWPS